jgi:hypothetical protein
VSHSPCDWVLLKPMGSPGISWSPCIELPHMLEVYDSAGSSKLAFAGYSFRMTPPFMTRYRY